MVPCALFCGHQFASADPQSPSIPALPLSPLATTNLSSVSLILCLFHRWVHLCHILDSTYKSHILILHELEAGIFQYSIFFQLPN